MWHDKITVPKQRLEDYAELEKHRQIQKEFEPTIECINNKLDQVTQSMDDISESLKVDRSATVSLLRDRMKCSLEYCKKQGYATSTDVSN